MHHVRSLFYTHRKVIHNSNPKIHFFVQMKWFKTILLFTCLLCYTSAQAIWLSPDPLLGKYPYISPYAYCNWNPIKYIDPDGMEVINKMDPLTDKTLYDAGNNIVDKDNHIFFVAHGSVNGIYPYEIGEMTAESFVNYLSKNSELWKNTKDKSSIVIALISCETGKGENPIAQQISNLLPEAIIIAPTEEVKAAGSGDYARIIGVAKSEAATLGDAKDPKCSGVWNAYQNGELIGNSANGQINYIYKDKDNF